MGDLHGNQVAAFNQAGTAVSDAFAYDAWGVVVASVTSALPTPWRYQGRMLESAAGTPDLYDFQARSYNPALGTFTSLDSKLGSAQNTALLNGYLYANANPATLVDPDGHSATDCPVFYCGTAAQKAANAAADTSMQKAMKETPREAAKSGSCTYQGGGSQLYCVDGRYDGSQMATTSTTTWGMTTSTTSTTTYGMTTSATVSNTTGGKTTTTTSNHKTGQAAAAGANQGCDWNPFSGNGCVWKAPEALVTVAGSAADAGKEFFEKARDVTARNLTDLAEGMGKWGPPDIGAWVAANTKDLSHLTKYLGIAGLAIQAYGVAQKFMTEGPEAAFKEAIIYAVSDVAAAVVGGVCEAATAPETVGLSTFGCIGLSVGTGYAYEQAMRMMLENTGGNGGGF